MSTPHITQQFDDLAASMQNLINAGRRLQQQRDCLIDAMNEIEHRADLGLPGIRDIALRAIQNAGGVARDRKLKQTG